MRKSIKTSKYPIAAVLNGEDEPALAVDTGRKLNVSFTFTLSPVSAGLLLTGLKLSTINFIFTLRYFLDHDLNFRSGILP